MTSSTKSSKYLPGDLIHARYRVVRLLGAGGMAEVYLAEDVEMHDRKVALKLLFSHISVDQVYVERFIREVELTQKHSHPNIVKSFHYGKTDRQEQYFTMEYVDGGTLAEVLKEKGKFTPDEVCDYLLQTLSALSAAHKLGIVHRDIKPDNIMLTSDGSVKVTDFGIAKDLTSSMKLTDLEKGPKTYAYKAPELYVDEYDQRVDIYALGISAYELLTGKLPFEGETHQLLVAHLTAPIPKFAGGKSGIPAWFQQFVEACCAKKAADRFKSADEAAKFLNEAKERGRAAGRPGGIKHVFSRLISIAFKYVVAVSLSVLVFLLYIPLGKSPDSVMVGDRLDLALLDKFFAVRGRVTPPGELLIISVDEASYQKFGISTLKPWPRERMAQLLEKLSYCNPKTVLIDYLYSDVLSLDELNQQANIQLARAIGSTPTYISKVMNMREMASNIELFGRTEPVWLMPAEMFAKEAKGLFFANIIDRGVVRGFNMGTGTNKGIPPVAEVLFGSEVSKQELPQRPDLINFYGAPGTIKNISFHKALSDEVKSDFFQDKIIFIGLQLFLDYQVRQRDTFMTPYGSYSAGVEIHATTAGNLLDKSWIRRWAYGEEAMMLFGFALLVTYVVVSVSPSLALILVLAGLPLWVAIAYMLFLSHYFFPGLLLFTVAAPVAYALSILNVYIKKKRTDRILGID